MYEWIKSSKQTRVYLDPGLVNCSVVCHKELKMIWHEINLGYQLKFKVDNLLKMTWQEFNLGCPIVRFAIIACVAGCGNILLVHFLYTVKDMK
ncbi:uncharacterized protein LOC130780018 isoform X2 [Actinidia eriantha]|uniref:uncharacterized protein LOC130780018 isoform X2 n=1 Tax=Actinidia eriantha TaxID=165200 RepID=UPI00258B502C|nr:uncharacterized protein LOC130780018 isoform X2 [Actinidia eriantha]